MGGEDPEDRFVLNDFLPYLANRAGVKTGLIFTRDLQAFGVTLSEWRILIALWDNERLRLGEVADVVVIDLSTLSRHVRALERAGLVARSRSEADRRALSLVLTAKGRRLTARIIPVAKMHEHVASRGLKSEDLAALRRCLTQMFANLSSFERERAAPRWAEEADTRQGDPP